MRTVPDAALINHRIATARRSRTNGRFQQRQIDWVNVSPSPLTITFKLQVCVHCIGRVSV